MLEHDYKTTAHLQSIAAIPQIIEQSIYIDSAENEEKTKNPHVTAYHYHVCGLKIGGVDYTVKAVIAEHTDGSRYYDHKLTQIEKGKLIDSLSRTSPARISQEVSLSSASKDKRLSSILQANRSKVVDENGEKTVHSYEATEIELLAGQTEKGVPSSRNSNNSIYAANLLQGIESVNNPSTLLLENHSKVVDKNGEPQVVYHGTPHFGFSVFDDRKTCFGIFFSTKARTAAAYTGKVKATSPRIANGLPRHDGGWKGMSPCAGDLNEE